MKTSKAVSRQSISKKLRFDVFKRDSFTCQYCGQSTPSVVLELDHINPVSKGGLNDIDNLLTACFDCNRGKAAGLLTNVPKTVTEKSAVIIEREAQIKAFNKILAAKRKREDKQIDELEKEFDSHYVEGWTFHPTFRQSIRAMFLPCIAHEDLILAMRKACSSRKPQDAKAYFCGICWNLKRAKVRFEDFEFNVTKQ